MTVESPPSVPVQVQCKLSAQTYLIAWYRKTDRRSFLREVKG